MDIMYTCIPNNECVEISTVRFFHQRLLSLILHSMRKLTVDITYASTTNHKCIGASSVNFLINVNTYFTLTLVEELNPSDIYKIPLKLHSFNKLTIYLQKSCLGADNTYLT